MKWIELNGKKEPPPGRVLGLWVPDETLGDKGYLTKGILSKIEFNGETKSYIFEDLSFNGEMVTPSHYFIIEPPKNNQ